MTEKEVIDLLVEGGKAAPGQSTAPKLGAYKLNVGEVFQRVNEATAAYKGMQVPVKIIIDKETKVFEVKVGTPPVSSLIKKELGIEKAKTKAAEEAEKAAEAASSAKATAATAKATATAKPEAEAAGAKGEEKEGRLEKTKAAKEAEGEETGETAETEVKESAAVATTAAVEAVEKPREVIANLTMQQVVKIAEMKQADLLAKDLKAAVKMVIGTAGSMMGIQVEGKWPKEVVKDVNEGKWDSVIK